MNSLLFSPRTVLMSWISEDRQTACLPFNGQYIGLSACRVFLNSLLFSPRTVLMAWMSEDRQTACLPFHGQDIGLSACRAFLNSLLFHPGQSSCPRLSKPVRLPACLSMAKTVCMSWHTLGRQNCLPAFQGPKLSPTAKMKFNISLSVIQAGHILEWPSFCLPWVCPVSARLESALCLPAWCLPSVCLPSVWPDLNCEFNTNDAKSNIHYGQPTGHDCIVVVFPSTFVQVRIPGLPTV